MQTALAEGPFRVLSSIVPYLLAVSFIAPADGQTVAHGRVVGRVTDPAGASVAAARVTLVNIETRAKQTVATAENGEYSLPRVSPGGYQLEIEQTGFRRATVNELVVTVNETAVADVQLQIGDVTETVDVTSVVPPVQTQSVDLSALVNGRQIRELPLNGKNFTQLVKLAPGVAGGNFHFNTPSVSGSRPSNNNFVIDGLGSNDEREVRGFATGGGASSFDVAGPNVVSTEALQEFRVITSNADATFGRSSGGQINVITRSGTNSFHGSAYEYMRNDKLDARDFFNVGPFFDSRGRSIVPPFRQNLFGATLGGPIMRDKHFVFGSYEGFRQRLRQQTVNLAAPNEMLINLIPGDLGRVVRTFYLDRGIISGATQGEFRPLPPADRMEAVRNGFAPELFDGNALNGEAGTLLIPTAPTRNIDQDSFLVRTDHILTDRLRVSGRYGFAQPTLITSSAVLRDVNQDNRRWQSGSGEFVYTASPNQIVELRGGVLRTRLTQDPFLGVDPRFAAIGISQNTGVSINLAGTGLDMLSIPGTDARFLDNQTVPQLSAMHSWTRRGLTLRSGFDAALLWLNIHNGAGRPSYTFNGFVGPTGLLGQTAGQAVATASPANASVFGAGGGPTTALRGFRSHRQEYFTQADWRLRANLTLNLGLRYSYFGVYKESNNAISNLYATDDAGNIVPDVSPFEFGRTRNVIAPVTDSRPLYQPDRNNWQPRVGLAWSFGASGRSVVRLGYGLYYDRLQHLTFTNISNNPPFTTSSSAANVPFVLGQPFPFSPSTAPPTITTLDPTLRNPSFHRVNAAFEQSIGSSASMTVAYVGGFGRDLFGQPQPNGGGGVPQTARPDPRFSTQTIIQNTSSSNYHALQLIGQQRFRRGLTLSLAYTLADSKDDSSADIFANLVVLVNQGASAQTGFQGGGAEFTPRPRSADWGRSDFLVRHNVTISHVWELPVGRGRRYLSSTPSVVDALLGGWSLSGIVTLRSGEPANLQLGVDANDDGDTRDRPALLTGSLDSLYGNSSDRAQFLVTAEEAMRLLGVPQPLTDPLAPVVRNALGRPGSYVYDVSLLKRIRLREAAALTFEANAFNVFNHPVLGAPIATVNNARFGRITGSAAGSTPRQLQVGVKISF